MAESITSPSSPAVASPLTPSIKENRVNVASIMEDLDKSQANLVSRLQGLKQEIQKWRSKLDTQVKTYKDELSGLKSSLSLDLDQLRSEFDEIRGTLQQQQEDMKNSLKTLGIEDAIRHETGNLQTPFSKETTPQSAESIQDMENFTG